MQASVRSTAAEYLVAKPDDFVMTESTSQGLRTIYNGLKLRLGQEILSTEQEHAFVGCQDSTETDLPF
jgi:selenocysteine lyase/cysteine desulfurase